MAELYFTQTKLSLFGKSGVATPDKDGYYDIVIGGLNTHNNSGSWYYTANKVLELFGPGSLLHRKISNGCLRGEVDHPRQMPNEKYDDYLDRMMSIDLNNVCAHFKDVWIDKDFGKNHPKLGNPDLIAIMGKVKPAEPKGAILKQALENPSENACFSVRSLASQELTGGKIVRTILEIITFDFVNEGGLTMASKWDSPATESIHDQPVMSPLPMSTLRKIAERKPRESLFSLESSDVANYILSRMDATNRSDSVLKKW